MLTIWENRPCSCNGPRWGDPLIVSRDIVSFDPIVEYAQHIYCIPIRCSNVDESENDAVSESVGEPINTGLYYHKHAGANHPSQAKYCTAPCESMGKRG